MSADELDPLEAPTGGWVRPKPAPARVPATPAQEDVLTADEVAAILHVDRKMVYEFAGRGEIPCRRLGRHRGIPRRKPRRDRLTAVGRLTRACRLSSDRPRRALRPRG